MKRENAKLAREQLDSTLSRYAGLTSLSPPPRGWIRAVRDALCLNVRQFALRMGVNKSRIPRLERDEVRGAVTIRTMQRAANALGCVFVYAIVPEGSLESIVRDRARLVAERRMARVSQTMRLENQALSEDEQAKAFAAEIDRLAETMPRTLWDES